MKKFPDFSILKHMAEVNAFHSPKVVIPPGNDANDKGKWKHAIFPGF